MREVKRRVQASVAPCHGSISRRREAAPELNAITDTASRNSASKPWYR
jgi:hypothetical protein